MLEGVVLASACISRIAFICTAMHGCVCVQAQRILKDISFLLQSYAVRHTAYAADLALHLLCSHYTLLSIHSHNTHTQAAGLFTLRILSTTHGRVSFSLRQCAVVCLGSPRCAGWRSCLPAVVYAQLSVASTRMRRSRLSETYNSARAHTCAFARVCARAQALQRWRICVSGNWVDLTHNILYSRDERAPPMGDGNARAL